MFIHIALYQFQDGIQESEINQVLEEVKGLRDKIPGLIDIYCGKNYHEYAKNFTHGIVVIGRSQEAIDQYRGHSDHALVAQKIEAYEEDGIGFDFISIQFSVQ